MLHISYGKGIDTHITIHARIITLDKKEYRLDLYLIENEKEAKKFN